MGHAGLYIHVPFCTSVCPYCDFAVTIAGRERRLGFLDALEREIGLAADHGLTFDTVYLGGGTPTSLRPDELAHILDVVRVRLVLASDTTFFLEINPEDVDSAAASEWRGLGFGFASLGVQSFDDDTLSFLGRGHDAARARRAAEILLEAEFPTVSFDLIFGLPGQTTGDWRRQLAAVLELGADHLSCYQLTVHEGTVFGNRRRGGELIELGEDQQAELYLLTHEALGDAGWVGYEVSNFAAAPDHRSRHNSKYWNHTPYIGLGPSAHSLLGRRRWWNRRKLRLWSAAITGGRSPIDGDEELTDDELLLETVILGLRTIEGIDRKGLEERFGGGTARFDDVAVRRLVESGHLVAEDDRLRPSPSGMAVADALVNTILVSPSQRPRPPARTMIEPWES